MHSVVLDLCIPEKKNQIQNQKKEDEKNWNFHASFFSTLTKFSRTYMYRVDLAME